jgi:Gpi18-like mannosyltransferase
MLPLKVPTALQNIPRSVKAAIIIVLAAKLLVFALGYAAAYMDRGPASPILLLMNQFAKLGAPQDSLHYIDIAKNWYVNTGDAANFIVFFPLYPFLIRILTINFNYINLSALVISNVSSLFAIAYLYKLARLDFDEKVALKAILFLSIFPTAYFLSAPYTEGLFFALIISSLYYARLSKWAMAGTLGFFATLTRLGGLLMLPVLLVEYLHQKGWKPRKTDLNILWILLVIAGFLIYLNINNQVTGNPFTFLVVERVHWYNTLDPIKGLTTAINWAHNASYPDSLILGYAPLVFAIFGLLMVAAGSYRRLRPSHLAYMLLAWLLAVSTSFWLSVPRYVMAMFPMFILLGTLTQKKIINITIAAIFIVALCYFTVLFAIGRFVF